MARNRIRKYVPDVEDKAEAAIEGLRRNEALAVDDPTKIAFKHSTAALLTGQRSDLVTKQKTFVDNRALKRAAGRNRHSVCVLIRHEVINIGNALKPRLGSVYSLEWNEAGWTHNNLETPEDAAELSRLLEAQSGYFTTHADHEIAAMGASAEHCTALRSQLTTAMSAETATLNPHRTAKTARNLALTTLFESLNNLIAELKMLVPADDPRWYDYGFLPPALVDAPGACAKFVAEPGTAAGEIDLDWLNAALAAHYSVELFLVGTDEAFHHALTVQDSDATLTGLPSGTTARVRVRAVNEHGQGPLSEVLEVVVP